MAFPRKAGLSNLFLEQIIREVEIVKGMAN